MAIPLAALLGVPAAISATASLFGRNRSPQGQGGFMQGAPGQFQQVQRFNPDQQQALSQILQQALGGMQNPMEGFQPLAQQARSQFETQTIPSLAERFTAMGGGQRSSAFQSALGGAGADLEESLAAMGSQYGMQRQNQLMQLLGLGLTPQFETAYQPAQQPGIMSLLGSLAPFAGQAAGSYFAKRF